MIYLFFWFLGGDSIIAEHPRWMVSKSEWNPPSYVVIAQDDNMERTVSAWSNYTYRLKRMRPLSAKNIAELDRLVKKDKRWRKENWRICKVPWKGYLKNLEYPVHEKVKFSTFAPS